MSQTASTLIAVLAALGAAGSFGVAAALQHRQAQLAAPANGPSLRLLATLAGRPLWLAGILLAATAYGLQALALAFGPLALVAPIVATDLVFALLVAARWSRPLRRPEWAGCVLAAGGVAAFLATAPPSSGHSDASPRAWLLAFAVVTLACVAAVAAAGLAGGRLTGSGRAKAGSTSARGRVRAGAARAPLTAAAAGAVFGLTAAVTLSLTRLLRAAGPVATLAHWQPWALLALGTAGLLLSASAFQAGPLAASLPVMDTVEPVCGVLLGTLLFGERLATSPAGLAVQLAGAAAAIAGITVLGRYPGTTELRNSANQAGGTGPAVRATASRREPVAGRREPVASRREPVTSRREPTAGRSAPAPGRDEPGAGRAGLRAAQ